MVNLLKSKLYSAIHVIMDEGFNITGEKVNNE